MTNPINASQINTSPVPLSSVSGEYIFDGFSLHDLINITMRKIDSDNLWKMDFSTYELAYNHGGAASSRYYRGRDIHLVWSIKASTPELFQSYMDALKKALSKVEWILEIRGRKIKATMTKMAYDRDHYHITWSPIDIVFTAVDSFWNEWAVSHGYLALTGNTSEEVSYVWTAPSSPLWYFVFGTGTTTTQLQITHKFLSLTINSSFMNGDVLLIDWVNKEVKKNGVDIDFTGVFPEFTEYSNPFTLSFMGATFVDTTLIYDNNYL